MDMGKTHGYAGYECKKHVSKVGEDGDDDGKEEEEDMGCVFFGVKQDNPHILGGGHGGIVA